MIRIELSIDLNYEIDNAGADFVFNIHAVHTPNQRVFAENLVLSLSLQIRILRRRSPATIAEVAVRDIPSEVMGFIYPSRYCQSDRLIKLANNEFGQLPQGYRRVQAIHDRIKRHVAFKLNSTNTNTSAVDTLIERVGLCRDFAQLMIALCCALNIPARCATGTDSGADLTLGSSEFQAYVEVYPGLRWYIFDPSGTGIPMGFVRFGTVPDAAPDFIPITDQLLFWSRLWRATFARTAIFQFWPIFPVDRSARARGKRKRLRTITKSGNRGRIAVATHIVIAGVGHGDGARFDLTCNSIFVLANRRGL